MATDATWGAGSPRGSARGRGGGRGGGFFSCPHHPAVSPSFSGGGSSPQCRPSHRRGVCPAVGER
ncbi:hypothetical protein E2C01_084379 [Portunus trituberculatus]|uniref:Uncharacterized protein n=1 Tax=Portunus trituberculatus TaxID=210409 RepID=A0A5B7J4N3_PORTR|nr:hypothetical protein [Portunus trituberculatus]